LFLLCPRVPLKTIFLGGAVATNEEQLLARPRGGERVGTEIVFFSSPLEN